MTPKTATSENKKPKNSKHADAAKGEDGKAKRKPARHESYSTYIHAVLKQVHHDMGITYKTMAVMNSFAQDMFERISNEASCLARANGSKTLTSRELKAAVRMVLPGDLAKHANAEGEKALFKYNNATAKSKRSSKPVITESTE